MRTWYTLHKAYIHKVFAFLETLIFSINYDVSQLLHMCIHDCICLCINIDNDCSGYCVFSTGDRIAHVL